MQIKQAQINGRSDSKRQWFISLDTELLNLTDCFFIGIKESSRLVHKPNKIIGKDQI